MSNDINSVFLTGNLGGNPEMGQFPDSTKTARASLAVNRYWKNADGGNEESVNWIQLFFHGYHAEKAEKLLKKGSPVTIEGELTSRSFVDGDSGEKRYITEVRVTRFVSAPLAAANKETKPKSKSQSAQAAAG